MASTATQTPPGQPNARLVSLLSELLDSDVALPHQCFAQRLAQMFSISDAISLQELQRPRPASAFRGSETGPATLQQTVLEARDGMIGAIINSFTGAQTPVRIPLPQPGKLCSEDDQDKLEVEPYQRFYQSQQRELALRIRSVRMALRDALASQSPQLEQLANLDALFEQTLSSHTRQCFAAIGRVVEQRFYYLWQQHCDSGGSRDPEQWQQPDSWLTLFHQEIQALLLAELELRLEPVLGLLEASEEHGCTPPA